MLMLALVQVSHGQEPLRLKGQVLEQGSNRIIPFVTIQIKGVPLGTIAKEDGRFAVKIPMRYQQDTLVFSSVGYEKLEFPIAQMQEDVEKLFYLKESVVELAEVTVTRDKKKRKNPLKILKAAIAKIPQNYPNKSFTFDAYYRERIIENGETIKFADASTTFQQSPYKGVARKRRFSNVSGFNFYSRNVKGIRTGSFAGFFSIPWAGERLHDHFGLVSRSGDRVKIHDSRASLNLSRPNFVANVEGGPLSTLAKDLVHQIDLFMDKKRFKRYKYELGEAPDSKGVWHYVVRFKPKKAPATLEWIQERRSKLKRTSRLDILSGEVWIVQETMAISKIAYSVQNEYRRHICNLQDEDIKHFGYEVEVNYQKVQQHWQVKDVKRIDEFIFKDTATQNIMPYSTVTELIVTNPNSELTEVPEEENFLNLTSNYLYEYPVEYDSAFWVKYESETPVALIDKEIRNHMEWSNTLEEQFAMKHVRIDSMVAPVAQITQNSQRLHGEVLDDYYSWLKDTQSPNKNPAVMDYLIKENEYARNYFIPFRKTERDVLNNLYKLVDWERSSDRVKSYGYWYWSKYEGDSDYRTIYRQKDEEGAKAEVLWDLDSLAGDNSYFSLDFYSLSPDNRYMAYAIDTVGRGIPPLQIKDMTNGQLLDRALKDVGGFTWTEDSQGFFYSLVDDKLNRAYAVKYHQLGTPVESDSTYFEAKDTGKSVAVYKSSSKAFIIASRAGNSGNELYVARNEAPFRFKKVKEEAKDINYVLNHVDDQFYIYTNEGAPNYRLMKTDTAQLAFEHWKDVIPPADSVILVDYKLFNNYLVAVKKKRLKSSIEVTDLRTNKTHVVTEKIGEVYALGLKSGRDLESDTLRYFAGSPTYKTHEVAYHMQTRKDKRKMVNQVHDPLFGIFSRRLNTKRLWIEARDGTKVPVSLVYMGKDKFQGNKALYVEGYGAYGSSTDIGYSPTRMMLLEKGFIYAYVHVRGGADLGRHWYEDGKMEHKMNSFTDFIDAIEYLTNNGFGHKKKVFASGGSAGGLLVAGAINMRPDLFAGAFLDVPFVDVINTMLDEDLPLTKGEFTEWGNPKVKKEYKHIRAYSPYENIKAQDYPRMIYYTGLNDRNVGYWEAAKMVAKLRSMKTDDNILLLRTDFSAGHSGGTGRKAQLAHIAGQYAILFGWLNEINAQIRLEATGQKP